ncbi:Hypothetical protein R9X50_00113900 [Acrodontium crateriforme]|uniref:Potassium transport protein n=1 Tax=Acrodontium crateriforme TaxID=150365 RepID=A0AAQ3R7M4_9PEZI|nr:Hypothetical protein R9X50_00113900 [Acrodontium crateriforme]
MAQNGGMFDPLVATATFLKNLCHGNFKRPEITFITVHYMIMVGYTIFGSIIIYGMRNMSYTDALFFAAGSATQSGLNPIDVNKVATYQQVTFMLIACVANPIFINTGVVFVRLYWFTRRFKHLVEKDNEARKSKQKTITRTKSEARESMDIERGTGVLGKKITVLHNTTRPNGMSGSKARTLNADELHFAEKLGIAPDAHSISPSPESSNNESHQSERSSAGDDQDDDAHHEESFMGLNPKLNREITFADDVGDSGADQINRVPQRSSDLSKHIEFIQRQQQNAKKEGGTLRIPGPKDFEKGEVPKELDETNEERLKRSMTRNTLGQIDSEEQRARTRRRVSDDRSVDVNGDDHTNKAIKFNEPTRPTHTRDSNDEDAHEDNLSTLGRIRSRLGGRRTMSRNTQFTSKGSFAKTWSNNSVRNDDPMPYLSWQATTGRNSQFVGLNEEQREELGGIEYRALKTLSKILIGYFVGFHTLGMIVFLPWIMHAPAANGWKTMLIEEAINPGWWAVFTPASMFNDLGFTLTPDSMNSFSTSVLAMLLGSFLIIIGNTGFPCMLRFTIWVISKCVPYGGRTWEELRFLLDHPRRCFTLLFPSKATWWLFWVLVLLNGIDLIFFIVLDLHDSAVTDVPPGYRVLDGLFQAASTRTAGFSVVNIAALHPGVQVSYLIMMYISVFPIAISVRRTNVYEEKSLGIWGGEESVDENDKSFVGQHLRRQLSFDLWYIMLGWFIICIVEGGQLAQENNYAFTMFSVLFEIVSAYGTVGLSLGYPNTNTSFSAQFHVVSKLIIVAMMIRGRHRGLPYALDRAILLPSENLNKHDEETTIPRRTSTLTIDNTNEPIFRRQSTWEAGELDEYGLPKQHITAETPSMTTGMGVDVANHPTYRRRQSTLSKHSDDIEPKRHHKRSRSLSQVIYSGLIAGPTPSRP